MHGLAIMLFFRTKASRKESAWCYRWCQRVQASLVTIVDAFVRTCLR